MITITDCTDLVGFGSLFSQLFASQRLEATAPGQFCFQRGRERSSGIWKKNHLDNQHNVQILRPELQLTEPNHCRVDNIREPLRNITFDNVNYIENCFMEYLINRTST